MNKPTRHDQDMAGELLRRVAVGDRMAFRALYATAAPKLFGVCLRMLCDRAEAEDALQDAFARFWTKSHRYDPEKALAMTWMIAVTRNLCIDRLRARPRTQVSDDTLPELPDLGLTAEMRVVAHGEADRFRRCLGQLSEDQARAIRGAYLDGLSYEALAQRHAIPLNTLRSWLHRGLQKIRECMA